MREMPFKPSELTSIGVELEFQIIDPLTYGTISRAKDLIRKISDSSFKEKIKPEITQSMIEINSSVHTTIEKLYAELITMREFLLAQADHLGVKICGGGTHPFQTWMLQKIFPSKRFKNLSHQFRYLSKRSAVFGQHIHIGCKSGADAIYLTHALAHYVPHFIALSASSPFYQGVDTGYQSSRVNFFNAFPLSGVMPYLLTWQEFSNYFYKMRKLKIVRSMKDFYWDIRPKPEFGTVEIRICDTPLTTKQAVLITAYVQTLAHYLLEERPFEISPDLYFLYGFNRFQAARYGFDGDFINPNNFHRRQIVEDISETLTLINSHARQLKNENWLSQLHKMVTHKQNDAILLRHIYKEAESLPKVVHAQCHLWEQE